MQGSYLTSFNKETLSIDKANDKILVAAFTNGFQKGKFLFSLYKNDPKTMSDVLYKATKYMNDRKTDALSPPLEIHKFHPLDCPDRSSLDVDQRRRSSDVSR